MPTYKLTIEYEGTRYAGWQRQPHHPTIQQHLEEALARIAQTPISTVASGRTDAGVHARGQVVSFRSPKSLAPEEWTRALNAVLPKDIGVRKTECVSDTFHARYQAHSKTYEYRIFNNSVRPVLNRHRVWHIPKPLNLDALSQASRFITGKHDFSSFEGSLSDNQNPFCHLYHVGIESNLPLVRLTFTADRFLKQMVRALVGTLVEIGLQKRSPDDMKSILEARDRRKAGKTAPPQGLCLLKVEYRDERERPDL